MLAGSVSMVAYPMQQLAAFRRTERRQSYGLRIKARGYCSELFISLKVSAWAWIITEPPLSCAGMQTLSLICDKIGDLFS